MSRRVLYNLNHFKINVGRMLLSTGCIYISSISDCKMLRAFAQTKWNEKPCIHYANRCSEPFAYNRNRVGSFINSQKPER